MSLSTYENNNDFAMDMYGCTIRSIDNKLAINNRFTIIIIKSGSGILKINEKAYSFIAPVMICLNEKEHIIIDESLDCDLKVIYFHPNIINYELDFNNIRNLPEDHTITFEQDAYLCKYFLERNDKYQGILSIGPFTYKRCEKMFEDFKDIITTQDSFWPCRSRSNILQILFLIDSIYQDMQKSLEDSKESVSSIACEVDEDIAPIITYLYNNYDQKITINSLTKQFGINRTTLSKKFIKTTGESIINYLNRVRINMASILLRDTRIPVYEVMEKTGFNDSAHFLRTFKKYTNFSPKEYRDKYCWVG